MKNKLKLNQPVYHKTNGLGHIAAIDENATEEQFKYCVAFNKQGLSFDTVSNSNVKDYATQLTKRKNLLNREYDWLSLRELSILEPTAIIDKIPEELKATYVRRFESGAVRSDDRGREKPSFVSPYAIKFVAEHFSKNAGFFNDTDSAKNYMKGIKPQDVEDSLERHFLDFKFAMMPHRRDKAKIKQTLVEIMANCVMALHQIGMEEDGDYKEIYPKMEYIKKEDDK